ncbi:hypothetical protein H6P81_017873 [Aristolochia fimbriata]|uniref:Protein kinase domain-containing protein n=1 Tax=Aristolochia fimbriata TaxID=158543 RepID=A0AAV7E0R8_ARIFI|nr:hypothetical protein H6P81_017873 [Aristolochia fimbriata]
MKLGGIIIIICYILCAIQLPAIASIGIDEFYSGEREGLIQLRESVTSTLNLHSVWTGPPCNDNSSNWVGIECFNSHVIHIVLDGVEMTGSLPPTFLQNITYLTIFSLRNNSLSGPLPNLTNLNHLQNVILSENTFSGSIPSEYIDLQSLTVLELEENHLTGEIPPFDQKSLVVFNVSHNQLDGSIPQTPALTQFPSSSYDHNFGLCGKPLTKPCPNIAPSVPGGVPVPPPASPAPSASANNKAPRIWSIVLIAVAALLVPFGLILLCLCYSRRYSRRKGAKAEDSRESSEKSIAGSSERRADPEIGRVEMEFFDKESPVVFDVEDLLRASAEQMGKGSLGSTYRVVLESGSVVTVKRLRDMNGGSKKEFLQQMHLIGKLKHENLVQMVSFYYSKEEKLVVYEYVPGRSLFELLHGYRGAGRVRLDWSARVSIVKDIAKGLAYLHQSLASSHKVPHANLKSSNVLVSRRQEEEGEYYCRAMLTDFGFQPLLLMNSSRKSSLSSSSSSSCSIEKLAMVRCPEVIASQQQRSGSKNMTKLICNHKVDVYCFGILLLEVLTGRIPPGAEFSPLILEQVPSSAHQSDYSEWVGEVVKQDEWSTDVLDLEILQFAKEAHGEMLELTQLAHRCTNTIPEQRPEMSQVVRRIEEITMEHSESNPTNPKAPESE